MAAEDGASRRAAMYGERTLGTLSLFPGNFSNCGYWRDFEPGQISVEERTASQADLYRIVLRRLQIDRTDVVLELGCGIAVGAALALREFEPSVIYGLDPSPDQLGRARRVNAELLAQRPARLVLRQGSALTIPYEEATFDRCYSVEAAQNFEDLATVAAETYRVLKPGGKLAATTFFTTHPAADDELRALIETVENGINVVVPIDSFLDDLRAAGFAGVHADTIGDRVWPGLDAWMEQSEFKDSWGRNWLRAYNRGLIDYYLVTADKTDLAAS